VDYVTVYSSVRLKLHTHNGSKDWNRRSFRRIEFCCIEEGDMDMIWVLIAMPLAGLIYLVCVIGRRNGRWHPP